MISGAILSIAFRLVLASGVAAGGMLYLNHWKNSLRAEGAKICADNVKAAEAALRDTHQKEKDALIAKVTELQSELSKAGQEAQIKSVVDLERAIAADSVLETRACLPASVNLAIGKRIRQR